MAMIPDSAATLVARAPAWSAAVGCSGIAGREYFGQLLRIAHHDTGDPDHTEERAEQVEGISNDAAFFLEQDERENYDEDHAEFYD